MGPLPVLLATFDEPSEVAPIVGAALEGDIAYVRLASAPPGGKHTLQLAVGDAVVASLVAELVGSGRNGEYPLRVRPVDPADVVDLQALCGERTSAAPERPSGSMPAPKPSRSSMKAVRFEVPPEEPAGEPPPESAAEDKTLASRGAPPPPMPSAAPPPEPEEPDDAAPASQPEGTVVFNPDDLLRSPPRQTGSEDSVTLPRSASSGSLPAVRPDTFSAGDEELATIPGKARRRGEIEISWNVRITPTTKDPLCGRAIAGGKYVLESTIGSGAIGIVFKASHRDLGRTVAIKVLNPRYRDDPQLLATFHTEARAASLLEHPNVARVYDFGQEPDGLVYMVMEYLSGYTLGSVLEARRRLSPGRAVDIVVQVCGALSAAHERGIVHRDVKPDNIVLVPTQDDEGRPTEIVKVCDFGIAALGAPKEDGVTAGSPEYMAPEQATGANVTPAADVYACGIVLYEMITGQVPFTADQAFRVLLMHRNDAPTPPSSHVSGLSPALEAVILRALEKDPAARFPTARDLRIELRKIRREG